MYTRRSYIFRMCGYVINARKLRVTPPYLSLSIGSSHSPLSTARDQRERTPPDLPIFVTRVPHSRYILAREDFRRRTGGSTTPPVG